MTRAMEKELFLCIYQYKNIWTCIIREIFMELMMNISAVKEKIMDFLI